jgi:opacity protein-like surface antigen
MIANLKSSAAAVAFLATLAFATPAAAQDQKGPYVSAGIGSANINDVAVDYYDVGGTFGGSGSADVLSTRFRLKSSAALRGSLGYDFGPIRADLEVSYSRHKLKGIEVRSLNGSAVTLTPADVADFCDYEEVTGCSLSGNTINFDGGRVRQLSALGNIWVDIPVGKVIVPYVGAGVGISGFELDGEGKGKFAWQVGAGVAVNVAPSLAITADVRHRAVGRSTIDYDSTSGLRVGRIKTTTLGVGLRLTF